MAKKPTVDELAAAHLAGWRAYCPWGSRTSLGALWLKGFHDARQAAVDHATWFAKEASDG